jgi:AAA domain-containing protein
VSIELATGWRVQTEESTAAVAIVIPDPVSLIALGEQDPDPEQTLLGRRFLCRGGGLLFVGPSGIGKSSAGVQQDLLWGLGKPAFGIVPAKALRILTIQAENDDGDLGEMVRGVCNALNITAEEKETIRNSVLYVSERSRTGVSLLAEVIERLLEKHRPDMLRIDPLLAYLGADINDAKETAAFLRNGLNPLLEQYNCGAIINHHTPKVINRDTKEWRPSDWMYAGHGSADLTNWARAIITIDPTHTNHVFKFIAAKRGGRIGWRYDDGDVQYIRYFCHDTAGGLAWREGTADDELEAETKKPKKSGGSKTKDDLYALVPPETAIPKQALISVAQAMGIGYNRARGFISELVNAGELHESRVKRPKTNPEIRISRYPQADPE